MTVDLFDQKWIYFENPGHKKQWVSPGQTTVTTPKRQVLEKSNALCTMGYEEHHII